eukprot:6109011-Heterocapsa_arctica.AAC.1
MVVLPGRNSCRLVSRLGNSLNDLGLVAFSAGSTGSGAVHCYLSLVIPWVDGLSKNPPFQSTLCQRPRSTALPNCHGKLLETSGIRGPGVRGLGNRHDNACSVRD